MQSSTLVQLLTKYNRERGFLRRLFKEETVNVKCIKSFAKSLGTSERALTDAELFKLASILVESHGVHHSLPTKSKSANLRKQLIANIENAVQPNIWETLTFLSKLNLLDEKNFLVIYHHPQYQKQLNEVLSYLDATAWNVRATTQKIINQLKRWDVFYGIISMFKKHFYYNALSKENRYLNDQELNKLCEMTDLSKFHDILKIHWHDPLLSVARNSYLLLDMLLDFHEFAGDILKFISFVVRQEETVGKAVSNIDKKLERLSRSSREIDFLKLKGASLDEVKECVLQTLQHNAYQSRLQMKTKVVPFQTKNNNLHDFFPKVEKNQAEAFETENNQLDLPKNLRKPSLRGA